MRKLRVLFVLGSLNIGGTERQVVEILRHLNRQQFEPFLYLTYRRGELLEQLPKDVVIASYWERHRPPVLNVPGRILLAQIRDLTRTIIDQKIDVVYDRASHMALTAGLATPGNVARVSVVVASPELDFAHSHRRFRPIKKALLRRAYLRADRVLTVSNGVREDMLRFYKLPAEQVVTCGNIFDASRIRAMAELPAPEFAADRFHVVCVGRLQQEKGQRYLLQAVDHLIHVRDRKEVLVWLIGDGPDADQLRQFTTDRGLEQYVRFEGYQANPLPYVRRAQLFCLPSLFEGMPNALVEAMICGTPVLASDCPSGPNEILANGRFGGLVPAASDIAIAEAIDDAIRNLESWRAKSDAARRHIEITYSLAAGMELLESILSEVAVRKLLP